MRLSRHTTWHEITTSNSRGRKNRLGLRTSFATFVTVPINSVSAFAGSDTTRIGVRRLVSSRTISSVISTSMPR